MGLILTFAEDTRKKTGKEWEGGAFCSPRLENSYYIPIFNGSKEFKVMFGLIRKKY